MKRLIFIVLLLGAAYIAHEQTQPQWQPATAEIQTEQRSSGFRDGDQVRGSGTVIRILPDDTDGSRHQRFIVRLASGRTLLIAHNIDLAPRIPSLQVGDSVSFYGEYAWNNKGGVIHWTHRDPAGRHVAGWLEREGKRYE
ncbi:MAG: DUF3465 domain-containing protein [Woeseiaceae bacterium]